MVGHAFCAGEQHVEIGSVRKQHLGGTHRMRSPRETEALVRPLLGGFGITRVANR